MPPELKHFYLFRHGECPFNLSGHIQGQSYDGELTAHGQSQARLIGQKLQNKHIEIIISSPLKRTRQTAQIVASCLQVPILFDQRLQEVNMGVVEGMLISEVEKRYAALYDKWRHCRLDDTTTRFENGETKYEVRRRVWAALNHYARHTPFHNFAVSGHGITLSQVMLHLGINNPDIPNGAVIHLTYDRGLWQYRDFVTD